MGHFLEEERIRQAQFKQTSEYFSTSARIDGLYKSKPRSFCLPEDLSVENLFPEIRHSAPDFFARHQIQWHDGIDGKPSNHLCDSQACCVNFLYPLADKPLVLLELLSPLYPSIKKMLPVEEEGFVSFEWIGLKNYLGERVAKDSSRTRGAHCTSADAIVMFENANATRHTVLIEWKYTESYNRNSTKFSTKGTDKTRIYQHLFDSEDCPLKKELIPEFDSLFYEPFYQFMRQQFLANKMEVEHERGADIVSVLHIAPAHNKDFQKITSAELTHLGGSATEVWDKVVKKPNRFISISTEQLFCPVFKNKTPETSAWIDYLHDRYNWISE